jgi:hypothetical protein
VNTIVLTLPNLFARAVAGNIEMAAMRAVLKKIDPRVPSERENLLAKK